MTEPLTRTNLSESLAKIIVDQIKNGLYPCGTRLPTEKELMARYRVGRSSVREAFQSLAIMGLLETRPGQGTFVKDISKEVVISPHILAPLLDTQTGGEFLEARLLLEPSIAGLAAARYTDDESQAMEALLARCERAIAAGKPVTALNGEFHLRVAMASHNIIFVRFMESIIRMLVAWGEALGHDRAYLQWELGSHREVLEAIRARSQAAAQKAMEIHIRKVAEFHARFDRLQPNGEDGAG